MEKTAIKTDKKLIHAFSLWERTSKNGMPYFSGFVGKDRIVGFYSKDKSMIEVRYSDRESQVIWNAALTLKKTKAGGRYALGVMQTEADLVKIVAFFKEDHTEKQPLISAFIDMED